MNSIIFKENELKLYITMATEREKKLVEMILKERLQRETGKKVILREATTPQFQKLIKRAKALQIETADELSDLIASEFDDENAIITGADYEIAKKQLRLKEGILKEDAVKGLSIHNKTGEKGMWATGTIGKEKKEVKITKEILAKYPSFDSKEAREAVKDLLAKSGKVMGEVK